MQLLTVFLFSFFLTGILRQYALSRNVLDIPNHRSSHVIATPRGGGLAFVLGFLGCVLYGVLWKKSLSWEALAYVGGGSIVASIGLLDDHASVSIKIRILGHFLAAALALFCLHGMPSVSVFGWILPASGWLLNTFALFYLVWFLNLYNFMDGIDGLAALEAVTICLGASLIYVLTGNESLMVLPLILALSVAGFLYWNFPFARIFMGDVGSGFLGLTLALLSIQAAQTSSNFFWSWLILSGVFIVDSTVTLIRRLVFGHKIFEAHRLHAYQHATDLLNSHFSVTMAVLAINTAWLLPLAVLVGCGRLDGIIGLLIAYIPLIVLAFQFQAGCSN